MVSTTHVLKDSRIYYKEAISLKKMGYDVTCIYIGKEDITGVTEDEIKYIEVKACAKTYDFCDGLFEYKNYAYERYAYETYMKIYNICNKLKCNVYHLQDLYLLQIVTLLKKLPFKPKVIYDVHESYPDIVLDYNKNNKSLTKYLFYLYLYFWELVQSSKCDYVINVEQNINTRFEKFLGKNKTSIIFNYPLIQSLNNVQQYPINSEEKKYDLIYCGGINKLRGVMDILKAVNVGKEYKKDLKVVFVGPINDGRVENEIKNYLEKNDLKGNVVFTGRIPFLQVWSYYRQSKIGLVPLHNIKKFRWAIPIKMFEYMISGLPVVGSDLPHIREVVLNYNYKCGEIVSNIENPNEFWKSIYKIMKNRELYHKYSNNSKQAINKIFNWSLMEKKISDIYKTILSKR